MEWFIIYLGIYLAASLLAMFVSKKLKVPVLLFFLAIGMISQTKPHLNLNLSNITTLCNLALSIILFTGAIKTPITDFKKYARPTLMLSTVGVLASTVILGLFIYLILDFGVIESLLCAAVVSTTDTASIFSIFKQSRKHISHDVKSILEIESGCNDPVAYAIIALLISYLSMQSMTFIDGFVYFANSVIFGALIGILVGKMISFILMNVDFPNVEKIVILMFATIFITFGLSSLVHGNVLLAIYIAGILIGNAQFSLKLFTFHFFDTMSWLVQIALFILLGIIVGINDVAQYFFVGLIIALLLIFVVRPISVLMAMYRYPLSITSKFFISWAGLKGSIPIIFTLYVVNAGIPHSEDIFYIVFYVVVFSVLIQGILLEKVATLLNVVESASCTQPTISMFELEVIEDLITKVIINEMYVGMMIKQIPVLNCYIVVSIKRGNDYLVPSADTVLELADELLYVEKSYCPLKS